MTPPSKHGIIRAFGGAHHYHQQAQVQRQVAETLATRLPPPPFPSQPKVLEVGCGTGFLSQHLLQRWPQGTFLLSDISWPMVQRCRANLGRASHPVYHAVLDGEHPALATRFDLIAASMVFQWFAHPIENLSALHDRLHPGGCLVFATLGPQTFREWRTACTTVDVSHGLPTYPSAATWTEGWPAQGTPQMHEQHITVQHPSSLDFLRSLKRIGANRPTPGYRPQPAGILRSVLRRLDQHNGFAITYHILYGTFFKGRL